jgi:hypothetical protein
MELHCATHVRSVHSHSDSGHDQQTNSLYTLQIKLTHITEDAKNVLCCSAFKLGTSEKSLHSHTEVLEKLDKLLFVLTMLKPWSPVQGV